MQATDLKGKRVVITGGASGIGLATAIHFSQHGSQVIVLDNDNCRLSRILEEHPIIARGFVVDVSAPEQVKDVFEKIGGEFGGVDVCIANAGISFRTRFLDISPEQWNHVLNVNLNGVFYTVQAAAWLMLRARSGVILMTASTNGVIGHPLYADYNASKAGVISLAKTMALELAPYIRVNAVCPGYVLTPMQLAEYTPDMLNEVNKKIPLQRHARPEEIARLFAYLASDDAAYITGASIAIDGGELAGMA